MSSSLSRMVRNALTMMVGTLASRILGLAREMITAALFGASRSLDAFYVAYTLANLARQLLAEGALSAAFVPVFAKAIEEKGKERGKDLAQQASGVLLGACTAAVILGIAVSPFLVRVMAPGFDAGKTALAISLTRRLFPYLALVSAAALAMGVLNSMDRFFIPAVAPALANGVYIMVTLLFASRYGVSCLVAAVMAGGVLQMSLQVAAARREGISLAPSLPRRDDPELRRMVLLFVPYAAGLSLNQVNPIISRVLGSFLQDGAISVLTYANRLIQLPLGLVVIAISQAVLPELSRCALQEGPVFRETLRDAVRFALFAILPITVGACAVSGPVVHLLFYRGAFDRWALETTSRALFMYALGLPGMACSTVVMRALYAKGMSREAIAVTSVSVGANLLLSGILMKFMGIDGLALAPSLAFTLSSAAGLRLLSLNLRSPIGLFDLKRIRDMSLSLALLLAIVRGYAGLAPYPALSGLGIRSAWVAVAALLGMAGYCAATLVLKCREWEWIKSALTDRKRGTKDEKTGP